MQPFVKWAGGKKQLLTILTANMPKQYNRYYEPFVGGGALLLNIRPNSPVINDINKSLINTYTCIRDYPDKVISIINQWDQSIIQNSKNIYYEARNIFNTKLINNEYDVELAGLFIFLNKHCFNGLFRVNKKGLFNVPYNNSTKNSIIEDNIYKISAYLKNVIIYCDDFINITKQVQKDDFIFFDSPYDELSAMTFNSYTKDGFLEDDHIRLANEFKRLSSIGAYCILTNHNTELINNLYSGFSIQTVSVKRSINRNGNNRTGEEVIIKNF